MQLQEPSNWEEIEAQVRHAEQFLLEIKQRLVQVRDGQSDLLALQEQQQDLQARIKQSRPWQRQEIASQLADIKKQLETIEVEIESRLLSWSSFREPFWQIVRFGGLGFLLGVLIERLTC